MDEPYIREVVVVVVVVVVYVCVCARGALGICEHVGRGRGHRDPPKRSTQHTIRQHPSRPTYHPTHRPSLHPTGETPPPSIMQQPSLVEAASSASASASDAGPHHGSEALAAAQSLGVG